LSFDILIDKFEEDVGFVGKSVPEIVVVNIPEYSPE
jgi:hypothetical protein